MIINFLAIVPFVIGAVVDLRVLCILRLFRFRWLFTLARNDDSLVLFASVIQRKKSDLVVAFTATGLLLLLASSSMYFIKVEAQPDAFGSIPETL